MKNEIDRIFDLLDDWRQLPAYQLERRSDIFFALYLNQILEKTHKTTIDLIIPEFPVRIGEISNKYLTLNRSFKIDYLAYSQNDQRVFLVELKTDLHSLRDKQNWYLESASKIKVSGLVNGLLKIYDATNQKNKYNKLLDKLESINWIKRSKDGILNTDCEIQPEVVFIQPVVTENIGVIISFDDIIQILSEYQDTLSQRFIKSLGTWKNDVNQC